MGLIMIRLFAGRKFSGKHVSTNVRSTWIDEDHIRHVAEIEGFESGEMVNYQIPIEDLEPASFQTGPASGDNFSIAWLGDNQEAYERFTTHSSILLIEIRICYSLLEI